MWPSMILALVTSCWQDHEQKQSFWVVWGIWIIDGSRGARSCPLKKKKGHLLKVPTNMWIRPALEEKLVKKKYSVTSPSFIQHFIGSVPCGRHPVGTHPRQGPALKELEHRCPWWPDMKVKSKHWLKVLPPSFPTFLSWSSFTNDLTPSSPPNSCHCVLGFAGN